jgi:hypothetical protein
MAEAEDQSGHMLDTLSRMNGKKVIAINNYIAVELKFNGYLGPVGK